MSNLEEALSQKAYILFYRLKERNRQMYYKDREDLDEVVNHVNGAELTTSLTNSRTRRGASFQASEPRSASKSEGKPVVLAEEEKKEHIPERGSISRTQYSRVQVQAVNTQNILPLKRDAQSSDEEEEDMGEPIIEAAKRLWMGKSKN